MESKALEVNISKSIFMLAGRKRNVEKIRQEIEKNPIKYNGTKMKEKLTEKWLGDIIDVKGNKESSLASINERKYRIFNSINETVAIIEDSRLNRLGSMKSAVSIWELAILPALLHC